MMDIELLVIKDYSQVFMILKFDLIMFIVLGVSVFKIIIVVGSNGVKYKQLVKGGYDDFCQDVIME